MATFLHILCKVLACSGNLAKNTMQDTSINLASKSVKFEYLQAANILANLVSILTHLCKTSLQDCQ